MIMIPEQALRLLVATAKSRKITAIVIGRTIDRTELLIAPALVREIGQEQLRSYQRYSGITLTNGSRIFFASPNGLYRQLAGLLLDFAWITTPITDYDGMMIRQRMLSQSAVILETNPL
jgi:hypothetical protein